MSDATPRPPGGLGIGGRALWRAIVDKHELDAAQLVQLTEACRSKDRLDKLDALLRGEVEEWVKLTHDLRTESYILVVDGALSQANSTANLMKQLLAALRLPDEMTGKRPQYRGARGVQQPSVPSGKPVPVSALERARAARAG